MAGCSTRRIEPASARNVARARRAARWLCHSLLILALPAAVHAADSAVLLAVADAPAGVSAPGPRATEATFQEHAGASIKLSATHGTWWRVTATRTFDASSQPRMVLSDVFLARVQLWRPGETAARSFSTYGPDRVERLSTRGLAIELPEGIRAGESVYLGIEARGVSPLRVSIEAERTVVHNDILHSQIRAALLASMLVTTILALGFGIGLGERSYLLFAMMTFSLSLHTALLGGEIQYLPPVGEALERNLQAVRLAAACGTIAIIEFLRRYLELATRQPVLSRVLAGCSVILAVNAVATLFTVAAWVAHMGNSMVMLSGGLLIFAAVRGCFARQRAAGFVLVSFAPALFLAILRTFEAMGLFVGPWWLGYLFPASVAFACLLLTLGLTERMLTIRRERQAALLEAQSRGRQLATASHDIRQPLLALRTALTRLGADKELAPEHIERFRNSLEYLDQLAAQYSAPIARDVAGSRDLAPGTAAEEPAAQPLQIELLLRNVELMFRDEAEAKGLRMRVRGSRLSVSADAMATMRIVANLVSNAVKYTERGKVLVGCLRRGPTLALVVADTGPGMSAEELQRVQREGERGAGAAHADGSGLGLSIARRLADQHGFGFHARSSPGRGSVFMVELPLAG